ncbi:hypothetical protein HMPREF0682_1152 [Propionibacterium acidifaciens F0233]|uniref:Uncharacterized protein n=1 Tax=Propionibacterium acidifaciens F0233 TaxID=553198 RepID=U2QIB8_9ACTN|nr:hypothetical protein HMPREF0682_1152 [Propionibacterium acidifaciens F0233]
MTRQVDLDDADGSAHARFPLARFRFPGPPSNRRSRTPTIDAGGGGPGTRPPARAPRATEPGAANSGGGPEGELAPHGSGVVRAGASVLVRMLRSSEDGRFLHRPSGRPRRAWHHLHDPC